MGSNKIKDVDLNKSEEATTATSGVAKTAASETEETKTSKPNPPRERSKRYKKAKALVDRERFYELEEAVELLLQTATSNIDETVELDIVAADKLHGSLSLPHGTGTKQKIEIASEKTLKKLEKEEIDFDVLVASPEMMPKLAKYARILGPKGLMPNPKSGTITDDPKKLVEQMEKGEVFYRTEPKAPLLHLTIGKISFGKDKILENLESAIEQIKRRNIKKAVLTATQSPGIKLKAKKKDA